MLYWKSSKKDIAEGIQYFIANKRESVEKAPMGFLTDDEITMIFNISENKRPTLYRILLFIKGMEAIKSGALNLNHSLLMA